MKLHHQSSSALAKLRVEHGLVESEGAGRRFGAQSKKRLHAMLESGTITWRNAQGERVSTPVIAVEQPPRHTPVLEVIVKKFRETHGFAYGFSVDPGGPAHVVFPQGLPTIDGHAPTLAELLEYPIEVFDSREKMLERAQARAAARRKKRASTRETGRHAHNHHGGW